MPSAERTTWRTRRAATRPACVSLDSWADAEDALGAIGARFDPPFTALWRARCSLAATLAHAIGRLPSEEVPWHDGRWCVWICGARDAMEGCLAREGHLAEVLSLLCPVDAGWELVLIGPEMEEEAAVERGGCVVRTLRGTLHQLCADGRLTGAPDFLVLYNSGIGTLSLPLVEPWLPTVATLLALDRPVLLTCFHDGESRGEQEILVRHFGARVLVPPADNPLAHAIPVDSLSKRDEAGEAALAQEMVAFVDAARRSYETKRRRDAAAIDATRGGTSGVSLAGSMYAWLNGVSGIETANARLCWMRGSELRGSELHVGAARRARLRLRELCGCFGVSCLPQWLAGVRGPVQAIDSSADHTMVHARGASTSGRAAARLEARAVDAIMLAESLRVPAIAARALELGALPVLREALADAIASGYSRPEGGLDSCGGTEGESEDESDAAILGACDHASFAGVLPATRLGGACVAAIARLEAAADAVSAVSQVPATPPTCLSEPKRWRVTFRGEYVHARAEPSVSSTSCGKLERDATFEVDAACGAWRRVAASERLAGAWCLTAHPVHGTLIQPCTET